MLEPAEYSSECRIDLERLATEPLTRGHVPSGVLERMDGGQLASSLRLSIDPISPVHHIKWVGEGLD